MFASTTNSVVRATFTISAARIINHHDFHELMNRMNSARSERAWHESD
jgi:hypothetical protein